MGGGSQAENARPRAVREKAPMGGLREKAPVGGLREKAPMGGHCARAAGCRPPLGGLAPGYMPAWWLHAPGERGERA
jgi:hypothetical protein